MFQRKLNFYVEYEWKKVTHDNIILAEINSLGNVC